MIKEIKVIKIIDEYNLVINIGFEDGVKLGDKFQIYQQGEKVLDPETNEYLGTLDIVKATIVANDISPKLTVCTNAATTSQFRKDFFESRNAISHGFQYISPIQRPLMIDPLQVTDSAYSKADKTIKVGDSVRKLDNY